MIFTFSIGFLILLVSTVLTQASAVFTYLATVLIAGFLTYTVEPLRRSLLERQVQRND